MRIKILGKYWNLVRNYTGPKYDGHCDSPDYPNKTICVHKALRGERELEILIHEIMHAADWTKDEEWVKDLSEDLARILWRLNYRRIKTEQKTD